MRTLDRKGKIYCFISLIPVLAVMAVIFYFSAQPAQASDAASGGIVDVVMAYITKITGEISADAYTGIVNTVTFIVRKAAHFLEFAALGFFTEIHILTFLNKKTWLFSLLFSVLYAASDEFHQHFVSERAPRFLDICVDSAGAVCGILLVLIIVAVYKGIAKKKKCSKA